jgi:hypothetical protein
MTIYKTANGCIVAEPCIDFGTMNQERGQRQLIEVKSFNSIDKAMSRVRSVLTTWRDSKSNTEGGASDGK